MASDPSVPIVRPDSPSSNLQSTASDPSDATVQRAHSSSTDLQPFAVIPIDLGDAAAFETDIFPAEYYVEDGNFDKGVVLIRATVNEMKKIQKLGIDLKDDEDFIFTTRVRLEKLRAKQAKLVDNRKTLNPFKAFRNYRAARLLHEGSKSLYLDTKRTSEKIHREADNLQVVPTTQMRRIVGKSSLIVSIPGSMFTHGCSSGPIPPGVQVSGLAISLPDGFNKNVERTIGDARDTIASTRVNPFQENSLVSQLRDDEQTITLANMDSFLSQDDEEDEGDRPSFSFTGRDPPVTAPQIVKITIKSSPIFASNSSFNGLTNQHRSRDSHGATITQGPAP